MFQKLIDQFGSASNMARALGVTRGAVTQWGIDGLPSKQAIEIEKLTGGKFKAVDIAGAKYDRQ